MKKRLLYGIFYCISLLPLRILYLLADLLALLAGDVVRYRRKVVMENLRSSFPERDEKELRHIARKFYHFLADYFVETVKLLSISKRQMERRMVFENIETVQEKLDRGLNVSVYLGHYCNWEWVTSLPLHLKEGSIAGQIYHPLEDKAMDEIFLRLRGRFGAHSIPMASTLRTLLGWKKEGRPAIIGYIADQAPGYDGIHLFLDFLHHPETPVFTGAERISRMFGAPTYYAHMERPKRGYYTCRFIPLANDASTLPIFELSQRYYSHLEAQIEEYPQYWLWSHRRWKRDRKGFEDYHGDEAARQLTHL